MGAAPKATGSVGAAVGRSTVMITPTQVTFVAEDRRQDALAWAARAHLIAASRPSPSATPPPGRRIRSGLRQAVASLVALASIG